MKHYAKPSQASEYPLNEDEVRAIINATKSTRDKLIIELLAFTGCRRTELVLLRFMDINVELEMINMPTAKQEQREEDEEPLSEEERIRIAYQHIRRIPIINNDLKRDLQTHMELLKAKRHVTPTSRLIQSRQKESITEVMINNIVAKFAKLAGVKSPNPNRKKVHPHMFRHTFVRYARKKDIDFKTIQEWVGHSSIATTMDLYGHPTWEDSKEEAEKMKDFGV